MKVLDLFCGMGGWSIGFRLQGFDCLGVDIEDWGYPYELILQDCRQFHANGFKPDIVVASPPCKEWSKLRFLNPAKPGNPEKGMELVREAKRIIDETNPRFWIVENVEGSVTYIRQLLGEPKYVKRPYFLWGKFPSFFLPQSNFTKKTKGNTRNYLAGKTHDHVNARLNPDSRWNLWASALRARIPFPLSIALAQACKAEIITYKAEY